MTETADNWLAEQCAADGEHQYFGGALAVEHRYAADLAAHAHEDGLNVHLI